MEVIWFSWEYHIQQRIVVCSRLNKEIKLNTKNKNKIINSISPLDRWTNRTDEPEIRIVFKILYWL